MKQIIYSTCDLRGRIKAAARTHISRIVDAFNMTNIERSIKELLTLGTHAQRGLQYLVCPSVCLSVRLLP